MYSHVWDKNLVLFSNSVATILGLVYRLSVYPIHSFILSIHLADILRAESYFLMMITLGRAEPMDFTSYESRMTLEYWNFGILESQKSQVKLECSVCLV